MFKITHAKEEMPPKSLGPNGPKETKVSIRNEDKNSQTNRKLKKPKTKQNLDEDKTENLEEGFFVIEFLKNLQEKVEVVEDKEIDDKKTEDKNTDTTIQVQELTEDDFKGLDIEKFQKLQMQVISNFYFFYFT